MINNNPLTGKTVKIKNPGLLAFFYPNFILFRDENYGHDASNQLLSFIKRDTPLIYAGRGNQRIIQKYLKHNKTDIINTAGTPDIDFTNKETLLTFVYRKWNHDYHKTESQDKKRFLENLQEEDFYYYIKSYWVTGKPVELFNKQSISEINNLIKNLGFKETNTYNILFKLLDNFESDYYYIIESKIINFIEDSLSYQNQSFNNYSDDYKNWLTAFRKEFDNNELLYILSKYRSTRNQLKNINEKLNLFYLVSLFYE